MGEIVPKFRFLLINNENGESHELLHEIDEWSTFGINYSRMGNPYSGIVKTHTENYTFILQDAEFIRKILFNYGVNARVILKIDILVDYKKIIYNNLVTLYLDLTMSSWDDKTFSCPVEDGGFYRVLENKSSENHDIQLRETISFDGIFMDIRNILKNTHNNFNNQNNTSFSWVYSNSDLTNNYGFFGLDKTDSDPFSIYRASSIYGTRKTDNNRLNINPSQFFARTKISSQVNIQWSFDCDITILRPSSITITKALLSVKSILFNYLHNYEDLSGEIDPNNFTHKNDSNILTYNMFDYPDENNNSLLTVKNVSLNNIWQIDFRNIFNEGLNLAAGINVIIYDQNGNLYETNIGINNIRNFKFNSSISGVVNQNQFIQAIQPVEVFNNLINNINKNRYILNIDTSLLSETNNILLSSGYGLRGFNINDNNNFNYMNTNLNDFLRWIYIRFNLKMRIDFIKENNSYNIYFINGNDEYSDIEISHIDIYNNLNFEVKRDYLFTKIRVGYETDDNSKNGLNEYNCIFEFETPNTEREESILDLTSPYSAAVYSIETFIYENYGKFETDTTTVAKKTDNNIYVFSCKKYSNEYILNRDIHVSSGVINPESAWNITETPKRIMRIHSQEINSYFNFDYQKFLRFLTCERNSKLISGNIIESSIFAINGNWNFKPIIISFTAPSYTKLIQLIENNRNGYFTINYKNGIIKGHILPDETSVSINPIKNNESEFILISHKDNIFN